MKHFFGKLTIAAIAVGATASVVTANTCTDGNTIANDTLTIATGNPAYSPWVLNDDPESGEGFEAAFAWELARHLGYDDSKVRWVRTSFDEAIQPGVKNFDFNLQQFSILPERAQVIDFSIPYYSAGFALVVRKDIAEGLTNSTAETVRGLKFGGASGQTSSRFITDTIKPTQEVLFYDDMSDVTAAMQANQVEASIFDVPTALFLTAVRYKDGRIVGEFSKSGTGGSEFGLVFAKGNPLRDCVNSAIEDMKNDGSLEKITARWMNDQTGIPVINMEK